MIKYRIEPQLNVYGQAYYLITQKGWFNTWHEVGRTLTEEEAKKFLRQYQEADLNTFSGLLP